MRREEARRIAKAISRLPDLLKRPPFFFKHGSIADLVAMLVFGDTVTCLLASGVGDVPSNRPRMFACRVGIGKVYTDRVFQPVAVDDGK